MSSKKDAGPSEFLSCTSLPLTLSGKERRLVTPFSAGSLALSPSWLPPLSLQLWSSASSLMGPWKVQRTQEKPPRISAPLKQPKARLNCMVSRVLSSRPGGWADQCVAAQPPRLWLSGATLNPGRQRGGGGFYKGRGWGEEAAWEDEGEVDRSKKPSREAIGQNVMADNCLFKRWRKRAPSCQIQEGRLCSRLRSFTDKDAACSSFF